MGKSGRMRRIRKELFVKQYGLCYYCFRSMTATSQYGVVPLSLTLDHKIARCLGGTSDDDNLVASCYQCNQNKAHVERLIYQGCVGYLIKPKIKQNLYRYLFHYQDGKCVACKSEMVFVDQRYPFNRNKLDAILLKKKRSPSGRRVLVCRSCTHKTNEEISQQISEETNNGCFVH